MKLVKFMTSRMGRAARIMLGLVIMGFGLFAAQGVLRQVLPLIALIPIAGGILDFCLIGFAMGYPLKGADARKKLAGM